MKRTLGIFLALTMALSMFAGFTVSAAEALVPNGDFENIETPAWGVKTGVSDIVAEAKRSGNYGLKTVGTSSNYCTQTFELEAGDYTISAWIKMDAGTTGTGAGVQLSSSAKTTSGATLPVPFSALKSYFSIDGADWHELTADFTITEKCNLTLAMRLGLNSNSVTCYWDDITITEKVVAPEPEPDTPDAGADEPEILSGEQTACTGGWTKKNGTLTFTDAGTMAVTGDNSGSYAQTTLALTAGTTYRLAFKWKTSDLVSDIPVVKAYSTYTVGETKTFFQMEASDVVKFTDYSSSYKNPIKGTYGDGFEAVTKTNEFKEYVVYFTVPNFGTTSAYGNTTIWIGQKGCYNTGIAKEDWATIEIDDVSLKKSYNEISFYDENGVKLSAIPASGKVKARIHLAAAGTEAAIAGKTAIAAAYAGGSPKELLSVGTRDVLNGKKLTDIITGDSLTETDSTNYPAAKVIIPQTYEVEFDAATVTGANSLGVFLWDSISGMKPVSRVTLTK